MAGGVANTSMFSNNFDKNIKKIFMDEYARFPKEWAMVAKVENFQGAYLKEADLSSFGTFEEVAQGQGGNLDNMKQGNTKTQEFAEYKHNAQVTRKMKDDDEQGMIQSFPKKQALSANYTLEYLFWDQYNSGFTGSTSPELGLDGLSLFNASHPYIDYGAAIQSNVGSAALSYASLKTALTGFNKLRDEKGNPIPMVPDVLIVPPALEWKAEELLGKDAKEDPSTSNRAMNVIKSARPSLTYMVVHYLTSDTAWFLGNKANLDTRLIWRVSPEYGQWSDPHTDNTIYKAYFRAAATHFQWRGVFGSTGA